MMKMLRAHLMETVCLIEDAARKLTLRKFMKAVTQAVPAVCLLLTMWATPSSASDPGPVSYPMEQVFHPSSAPAPGPVSYPTEQVGHFRSADPARALAMVSEGGGLNMISPSLHSLGSMHQGSSCSLTTYDVDELNRRHDKDRAAREA